MGSHLNSNFGQKRNVRRRFAQCSYLHRMLFANHRPSQRRPHQRLGIPRPLHWLPQEPRFASGLRSRKTEFVLLAGLHFHPLGPMRPKSPRSSRLFKLLIKLRVATLPTSGRCLSKSSTTGIPFGHLGSTYSEYQYSRRRDRFREIEY